MSTFATFAATTGIAAIVAITIFTVSGVYATFSTLFCISRACRESLITFWIAASFPKSWGQISSGIAAFLKFFPIHQ